MASVNLTPYDSRAAQIAQQQKLAQLLAQQAQAPIEVGTYKGIQAPISPYAGINKILQSVMAAYDAKKANKDQTDLESSARQDAMDTINAINSPTKTDFGPGPAAPDPSQFEIAPGTGQKMAAALNGPTPPQIPQPPQAAPPPAPPPEDVPSTGPALAAAMGGPPQQAPQSPQDFAMSPQAAQATQVPVTAQDRSRMALQALAGGNPYLKDIAPTLYDRASKDAEKEAQATKVSDALSKVDIGDADPAVVKLHLANDDPTGAINYLGAFGLKKEEAKAKVAEMILKDKEHKEDLASTQENQRFIAEQASKDRRFAAELAHQDRQAAHADAMANRNNGMIDPVTLQAMAGQALEGDKSVFANLGRGNQGAANIAALRAEMYKQAAARGMKPADVARINAEYVGDTSAARAAGTRTGAANVSVNELPPLAKLSSDAYSQLGRGDLVPFNKLQRMVQNNTASPAQARAYAADYAVVSAYARALSPTGVPHVADQRKGEEILNNATGPAAHQAALDQIIAETHAIKAGASAALHPNAAPGKTVVRTGTDKATGRKVVQYSDGTTGYAP